VGHNGAEEGIWGLTACLGGYLGSNRVLRWIFGAQQGAEEVMWGLTGC
jgi:hypothetical protein